MFKAHDVVHSFKRGDLVKAREDFYEGIRPQNNNDTKGSAKILAGTILEIQGPWLGYQSEYNYFLYAWVPTQQIFIGVHHTKITKI